MKVYHEIDLRGFDAWSGAVDTKEMILAADKADEFDAMIEELYPDGIDETQLNDILWFEKDWIRETLGIPDEDEEDDDEEDEDEDDEEDGEDDGE